jgi:hypothetical protein
VRDIREVLGLPPDATGTEIAFSPTSMTISLVPQPEGEGQPIGTVWPLEDVLTAAWEKHLVGEWQAVEAEDTATRIR